MKLTPVSGFALAILLLSFTACDKDSGIAKGEVELFLLESYETEDLSCAIDNSSVEIEEKPLIAYSGFLSYNSKEHVFTLSESAAGKIHDLEHSVFGLAFAIVANEELIYTAYFWPAYSSASCQWIIADPLFFSGENELHVQLGYPGPFEGVEIPDERNNEKILEIFRRDGKLID